MLVTSMSECDVKGVKLVVDVVTHYILICYKRKIPWCSGVHLLETLFVQNDLILIWHVK